VYIEKLIVYKYAKLKIYIFYIVPKYKTALLKECSFVKIQRSMRGTKQPFTIGSVPTVLWCHEFPKQTGLGRG
jgi:hypothetical protein